MATPLNAWPIGLGMKRRSSQILRSERDRGESAHQRKLLIGRFLARSIHDIALDFRPAHI
jgi:hypothetical protein